MDRILVPLYKHVLDTYQSGDYSSSRPTTAVGLVDVLVLLVVALLLLVGLVLVVATRALLVAATSSS